MLIKERRLRILPAILAGLIGTLAMTAWLFAGPLIGLPEFDIIGLLGSMMTTDPSLASILGVVAHMTMGVIFANLYGGIWSAGFGRGSWLAGLVFGTLHGGVTLLTLPLILQIHPHEKSTA